MEGKTASAIAARVGLSPINAFRALKELQDLGLVEQTKVPYSRDVLYSRTMQDGE